MSDNNQPKDLTNAFRDALKKQQETAPAKEADTLKEHLGTFSNLFNQIVQDRNKVADTIDDEINRKLLITLGRPHAIYSEQLQSAKKELRMIQFAVYKMVDGVAFFVMHDSRPRHDRVQFFADAQIECINKVCAGVVPKEPPVL